MRPSEKRDLLFTGLLLALSLAFIVFMFLLARGNVGGARDRCEGRGGVLVQKAGGGRACVQELR